MYLLLVILIFILLKNCFFNIIYNSVKTDIYYEFNIMHDDNEWISLLENEYDEYVKNKKIEKELEFDLEFEIYLKKNGWLSTIEWNDKCLKEIENKKKEKLDILNNKIKND